MNITNFLLFVIALPTLATIIGTLLHLMLEAMQPPKIEQKKPLSEKERKLQAYYAKMRARRAEKELGVVEPYSAEKLNRSVKNEL